MRMGQQRCSSCGRALSYDSLSAGEAQLNDGKLTCSRCLKRSATERNYKALTLRIAIGAAVVLLAVGVFFPSLALLVLAIGSGLAILTGLVGFTLSGRARAALTLGGACALGAAAFGIHNVNERKEAARLNVTLAADAEIIEQLIREGRAIEADQRLNQFKIAATAKTGDYTTPEASATLQRLTQELDKWYAQTYGVSTPGDRALLQQLIFSFGEKTSGGRRRFLKSELAGERVNVSALLPAETAVVAEGVTRDPRAEETARLATFISNIQASVKEVEVTLYADNDSHEEVTKVLFTPEMLQRVRMAGSAKSLAPEPPPNSNFPADPRQFKPNR